MKNFMAGLRLAFNFGLWNPLQSEWTFAAQCIQPEEKERICQFMFQRDAKAAMAGRLLIRKCVSGLLQVPYSSLELSRTNKGKPYLSSTVDNAAPHFNIAHHGNFAVLATHPHVDIGVDIMKVELPMGRTVEKFFHDMRRQFTELEWGVIQSAGSEFNQLLVFYRHWCLKESMVKSLGAGIGFGLDRLEFHVTTPLLTNGNTVTDTVLFLDGHINKEWTFEETLLEGGHCIAVAYQYLLPKNILTSEIKENRDKKESKSTVIDDSAAEPFRILSFQELIANAMPQTAADLEYWLNFDSKLERPDKQQKSIT